MQEMIMQKFHRYLKESYPELLLSLQEENKLADYLANTAKAVDPTVTEGLAHSEPPFVIEERCLLQLIATLGPSKFDYLKNALEQSFPSRYEELEAAGILFPELLNLITFCDPVFEGVGFTMETEDDPYLRYLILGTMHEYLNKTEPVEL